MKVPQLDLKAQYATIKSEVERAIHEVIDSQCFILGEPVAALEKEIADYCRVSQAVGVASGTDALILAVKALGVGRGSAVVTSPYTFFASAGAVANLGGLPLFVDIKPDSFNIDVDKLAEFLEKECRPDKSGLVHQRSNTVVNVLLPVHLFGQCADMEPLLVLADKYGLALVEDAAQAIGAKYQGKKAGSFGQAGCFSFFPSKNLGGFGDGGMVAVNDGELADRIRILRVHGAQPKYIHSVVGTNSRLDALQAAVLRVKFNYLDSWNQRRRERAAFYRQALGEVSQVTIPVTEPGGEHTFHQYVIRARKRDELKRFLEMNDIGCVIYYPLPLHLQPCFQYLGYLPGDFPVAERAAEESLALPIYPELTEEQQKYVVGKIKEFYANRKA
ncbi:MAG: DegT/DnrJ/EryC1/StrS family aminotransferase [Thermodesulfobacteriota bacterium]